MYIVDTVPRTLFGEHHYVVRRKDYHNFDTWKYPARALKLSNIFDYVYFLKTTYGDAVKIEANRSGITNKYLGLLIRFNSVEAAQDLSNRCNEGAVTI
jgi:hypothetical protein